MLRNRVVRATRLALLLVIGLPAVAASAAASDCNGTSVGLVPLNDLGENRYRGYPGGLYPDGRNERPEAHEAAGLRLVQQVVPRDADGNPDAENGSIVLLSIGMSNTTQEFSFFRELAYQDPNRNPHLVIVDGAQGGMTAHSILDPDDGGSGTQFWTTVDERLAQAGVTRLQVQVAWVKEADAQPTEGFPRYAIRLQRELSIINQLLKTRFPNIQLSYQSSRIYAGYASTPLNPEPYAYESGFAVKWLIERQIEGDPALNYDPDSGEVRAPWLAWGPYLWADGLEPRSDGLIWECADFADDGTHPSLLGREKVAQMLLDFFQSDSTTVPWYVAPEQLARGLTRASTSSER